MEDETRYVREDVTINMMVRNEAPQVWYALMSTLPFVKHAIIVDTGSLDQTQFLLKDIRKRFPFVKLYSKPCHDATRWETSENGIRNTDLYAGNQLLQVRNWMLSKTKTKWLWIQDGDEVYTKDSAKNLLKTIDTVKKDIRVIFVPILWFIDFEHIEGLFVGKSVGRLFLTDELNFQGAYPSEMSYYAKEKISQAPGSPRTYAIPFVRGNEMYHYEMMVKPWRRNSHY